MTTVTTKVMEKGILIHCWLECKLMQPVWRLLNKMKSRADTAQLYSPWEYTQKTVYAIQEMSI